MSASPSAERGSVEPQPCCAHLRVVYRTEDVRVMVETTELSPGWWHTLTHGWWECSDCTAKFAPVARLESSSSPTPSPRADELVANALMLRCVAQRSHGRCNAVLDALDDNGYSCGACGAEYPPRADGVGEVVAWGIRDVTRLVWRLYHADDKDEAEGDLANINTSSADPFTLVPLYAGSAPASEATATEFPIYLRTDLADLELAYRSRSFQLDERAARADRLELAAILRGEARQAREKADGVKRFLTAPKGTPSERIRELVNGIMRAGADAITRHSSEDHASAEREMREVAVSACEAIEEEIAKVRAGSAPPREAGTSEDANAG